VPEGWTRAVLRFRVVVAASWLAVLVLGVLSARQLPPLLANSLAVPGTDSERARTVLREDFGEPDDGVFTVVFPGRSSPTRAERAQLERRLAQAARAHAVLRGRTFVIPPDIQALAPDVLRHRIVLTFEAEAEDVTSDTIVEQVLGKVKVP